VVYQCQKDKKIESRVTENPALDFLIEKRLDKREKSVQNFSMKVISRRNDMSKYAHKIKNKLKAIIEQMSQNTEKFTKNPETNFTRKRSCRFLRR